MRRADIEVPNLPVAMDAWGRSACYPQSTFYPLSNGRSTLCRGITKPCFRICSTRRSRSQATFCLCARGAGCRPARGDLWMPPLLFGRRPPQSNWPPGTVPASFSDARLGLRRRRGGISRTAPPGPEAGDHSLPPILRTRRLKPTPRCSEGSWGLSVQARGAGIFTGTAISLSLGRRQRRSRYTIRAGRNLPDKEFRYLRTVIVTAAVYRGFGSPLRGCPLTPPVNLPAPGTCQTIYFPLLVRMALCFW